MHMHHHRLQSILRTLRLHGVAVSNSCASIIIGFAKMNSAKPSETHYKSQAMMTSSLRQSLYETTRRILSWFVVLAQKGKLGVGPLPGPNLLQSIRQALSLSYEYMPQSCTPLIVGRPRIRGLIAVVWCKQGVLDLPIWYW